MKCPNPEWFREMWTDNKRWRVHEIARWFRVAHRWPREWAQEMGLEYPRPRYEPADPDPKEIEARAAEVRAGWSRDVELLRRAVRPVRAYTHQLNQTTAANGQPCFVAGACDLPPVVVSDRSGKRGFRSANSNCHADEG